MAKELFVSLNGNCKVEKMIIIKRTNSDNKDFQQLVQHLDAHLDERDTEAHFICEQYNKIDTIKFTIVAYNGNEPIGCGAIREYSSDTMEIKRMFISKNMRRNGIASLILEDLENWTKELGYKRCILETGKKLPEAIRFYEKNGYSGIPNYGQYECIGGSLCFEKALTI